MAGGALLWQTSFAAHGCRHSACLRDRPLRAPARRLPPSGVTCSAVVTDSAVPEGHKGLHGFLYGKKGADVHDNSERQYVLREVSCCVRMECTRCFAGRSESILLLCQLGSYDTRVFLALPLRSNCRWCSWHFQGEDDGTTLVDVDGFVGAREGERLTGVYALYDARRSLQYVGYARSIVLAIKVRASS